MGVTVIVAICGLYLFIVAKKKERMVSAAWQYRKKKDIDIDLD
jgi:hypothetical protein